MSICIVHLIDRISTSPSQRCAAYEILNDFWDLICGVIDLWVKVR
jgi:hypothetical protein